MVKYKKVVLRKIDLKVVKVALYILKMNDKDFDDKLDSHKWKMLYMFLHKTNISPTLENFICMIYLTFALLGDHTEYKYSDKYHKNFDETCLTLINTFNPVLKVYQPIRNIFNSLLT